MLKFGFRGSLGSNSLPEICGISVSFRYRSILIPDRCANGDKSLGGGVGVCSSFFWDTALMAGWESSDRPHLKRCINKCHVHVLCKLNRGIFACGRNINAQSAETVKVDRFLLRRQGLKTTSTRGKYLNAPEYWPASARRLLLQVFPPLNLRDRR